jgi:DNA-binding protein H-NS
MATYAELKAQAERLLLQAEELRREEINNVIADIKEKIAQYQITAKDLGLIETHFRNKRRASEELPTVAKYVGPSGEKWSGLGRRPKWLKDALAAGKRKDQFAA